MNLLLFMDCHIRAHKSSVDHLYWMLWVTPKPLGPRAATKTADPSLTNPEWPKLKRHLGTTLFIPLTSREQMISKRFSPPCLQTKDS